MEYIILAALLIGYILWRVIPTKGVETIRTTELQQKLTEPNTLLIDVRTPKEFQVRHIEGAVNVPVGSDVSNLPKDQQIVVICQSGVRSLHVCKQLKKLGYPKLVNVRGGMNAYRP